MPLGKNQHYVPQFYMKIFSNDQKNIQTYNLNQKKSFKTSIEHVCSKPYFYSKSSENDMILPPWDVPNGKKRFWKMAAKQLKNEINEKRDKIRVDLTRRTIPH